MSDTAPTSETIYEDVSNPAPDTTVGELRGDRRESESGPVDAPPSAGQRADVVDDGGAPPTGEDESVVEGEIEIEDDGMPSTEVMREAMKAVMDPEIGYNVVDLGLVYGIDKSEGGQVDVTMTLTTMGCPLTELIEQQVTVILASIPGVEDVCVEFTFNPPWSPEMMSDDVQEELRAMGMQI